MIFFKKHIKSSELRLNLKPEFFALNENFFLKEGMLFLGGGNSDCKLQL